MYLEVDRDVVIADGVDWLSRRFAGGASAFSAPGGA